jgi:hypothetical protein
MRSGLLRKFGTTQRRAWREGRGPWETEIVNGCFNDDSGGDKDNDTYDGVG